MDAARVAGPDVTWLRFGDDVILAGSRAEIGNVASSAGRRGAAMETLDRGVDKRFLHLVCQKGRLFQQTYPEVPVITDYGRFIQVAIATA